MAKVIAITNQKGGVGKTTTSLALATGLLKRGFKVLAVDLPSGLDADTGMANGPTVRADHTCTLVAKKNGFLNEKAGKFLGQIHVLDIGAPLPRVASEPQL